MAASFQKSLNRLKGIQIPAPLDYFHGLRARQLCIADNLVVFLRDRKRELQHKNFESRPHHRFVLIVCFETEGSVNVDGRIYHLRPGDAFLIKPYQFHFYLNLQDERMRWLFLTFEARDRHPFNAFANTPIALSPELCEQTVDIADAYTRQSTLDEASLDLLAFSASALLNELRAHSLSRHRELLKSQPYPSSGYDLVDRINTLMEDSLEENPSILQLAAKLSVSESHLRKRFKQLTGVSLGSYHLHYKLNMAVKLLVHSDDSLTQIAIACGYDSLAAFSRSFKAKLGVTPSQYRRNDKFERMRK